VSILRKGLGVKKQFFDMIIAAFGGAAVFLLGEPNGLFRALVAMAALDYVTGVLNAIVRKKLSSRVGFSGIAKKMFMFIIVMTANIIDARVIGGGGILRSATICFFIANESISIVENASAIGLPVPKKLRDVLDQLNKEDDGK